MLCEAWRGNLALKSGAFSGNPICFQENIPKQEQIRGGFRTEFIYRGACFEGRPGRKRDWRGSRLLHWSHSINWRLRNDRMYRAGLASGMALKQSAPVSWTCSIFFTMRYILQSLLYLTTHLSEGWFLRVLRMKSTFFPEIHRTQGSLFITFASALLPWKLTIGEGSGPKIKPMEDGQDNKFYCWFDDVFLFLLIEILADWVLWLV